MDNRGIRQIEKKRKRALFLLLRSKKKREKKRRLTKVLFCEGKLEEERD